jgi:GT2 family glycosyltransferase
MPYHLKGMSRPLIQCVLVLYQQSPSQSRSLSSLLQICTGDPSIGARLNILVQDNSPEPGTLFPGPYPCDIDFFQAPTNPGLAAAYNRAIALAKRKGIQWLLTLDQDTVLHRQFFLHLLAALDSETPLPACAFVPELVKDNLVLSPQIAGRVFYRRLPVGIFGFASKPIVAFNSAACLNIGALSAIGGYPEAYWLDYLDHIVFHRLQVAGGRVYILNSQLSHSLSLQNMASGVSVERYSNVLSAEWQFVRERDFGRNLFIHRLRLLKRALVHAITLKNKRFAIETLRAAIR